MSTAIPNRKERSFDTYLSTREIVPLANVRPEIIPVLGHNVLIHTAPSGSVIDGSEMFTVSRGPVRFEVIIDFGDFFVQRRMHDSVISSDELWMGYEHERCRILENHPDADVQSETRRILVMHTDMVNQPSDQSIMHLDPLKIAQARQNLQTIVSLQKPFIHKSHEDGVVGFSAARAAIPYTDAFGSTHTNVIYDAKRLKSKIKNGGIGVGMNFGGLSIKEINDVLGGQQVLSADPALASLSTQLAAALFCLANNIKVKEFTWVAMFAAQQGLALANEFIETVLKREGIETAVMTAGRYGILTGGDHPYYIKTHDGRFAAGDAGDIFDLLLDPELGLRKIWPNKIGDRELQLLNSRYPIGTDWGRFIFRQPVTLDSMQRLQQLMNQIHERLPGDAIGKAIQLNQL